MPANWCAESQGEPCSAPQLEIWDQFFRSETPFSEELAPAVYTGSCYFKSRWHDSNRESFGVAVFDRKGDTIYYGGRFGEFYEKNPWADLTLEEALAQGFVRYEDRFHLQQFPDHSDLNVSDSKEHFIFYWFRMGENGRKLYLLGQADGALLNFCELIRK